jgi:hypothetical protein
MTDSTKSQFQHAIVDVLARGLVYLIAARPNEERLGILRSLGIEDCELFRAVDARDQREHVG